MSLLKPTLQLILREFNHYQLRGPALALGVPEICATEAELRGWVQEHTGKACPAADGAWAFSKNALGQASHWVSPEYFFSALGLAPTTSVDIEGCEYVPDLVHDLNKPLPETHWNRYGVVVDPGTIEHVFDMRTCLTNVVRSLLVGGTVIHQVPVYMYNGGYYSLNPNVLNDFYAKNGFGRLKTYIIMWDRYHPYTRKHRCYEYTEAAMGGRHTLADADQCRYSPMMLFFAQKERVLEETVIPLQFDGNYHPTGATANSGGNAAKQSLLRQLRHQASVAADKYLPAEVVESMRARYHRQLMLSRSRKHSFWL